MNPLATSVESRSLTGSSRGWQEQSKVPSLQSKCCETICSHLFVEEDQKCKCATRGDGVRVVFFVFFDVFATTTVLGFDPVVLYALPETVKPQIIAALRDELPAKVLERLLFYASQVADDASGHLENEWDGNAVVPRERYFHEQWNDCGEVSEYLKKLIFAEFLRLSSSVDFDTVFISIALADTTLHMVPLPKELPLLKRLVVRECLYDISPTLIANANKLEWLEIESDEVVRADGTDFMEQV
jgi:hypothetical protein